MLNFMPGKVVDVQKYYFVLDVVPKIVSYILSSLF